MEYIQITLKAQNEEDKDFIAKIRELNERNNIPNPYLIPLKPMGMRNIDLENALDFIHEVYNGPYFQKLMIILGRKERKLISAKDMKKAIDSAFSSHNTPKKVEIISF